MTKALAKLGMPWRVVHNRHQIMILPDGVTKVTGLTAALRKWRLRKSDVVAVGDAENDLPLIEACGCGAAVANAIPALKKKACIKTKKGSGSGVVELIGALCGDDRKAG